MYFCTHRHGWIFPAENRAVPRLLRERHQVPFVWSHCPFCGERLPDEVSGFFRSITEPPPGDDGEE
jgi:hypothetical protein